MMLINTSVEVKQIIVLAIVLANRCLYILNSTMYSKQNPYESPEMGRSYITDGNQCRCKEVYLSKVNGTKRKGRQRTR
uniref:Uncharacterized protein n=1 Tax=Megaselia scalaris TaxID=36166 RepID=T1GN53_MEGSC